MEDQASIDLGKLKGKNIPDEQYIIRCYNNPLEELNQNYEEGRRIMAVKLKFTDEEEVVLESGYRVKDLARWMEKHEDAYILLKTDEWNKGIFLRVKDQYPNIKDRLIVEQTKFDQYNRLSNKAFRNIFFNAAKGDYSKEEILDFLKRNPLAGVILDEELVQDSFIEELKNLEISIYLDGVDEDVDIDQYENIDGFLLEQ